MLRFRTALTALAALLLAACAPIGAPKPPPEARPALWKLSDADTTIWLFGTIHVLPEGYVWRGPKIDAALAGSDRLVIEAVLNRDPAQASAMLLRMGQTPGLPPLIDRVSKEKRPTLEAMIERSKLPRPFLDGLETWSAALMLVGVTLTDLKLAAGAGVEPQLEALFGAANKPVEGLETAEQQLGYFDALPESAQVEFLDTLLDEPNKAREDFDAMLAAWARGDEKAIAATFDEDLKLSPHLREVLLRKRNAAWADALAKRLETPGTIFVAVGAGHLAGAMSVQKMLAAKGLTVERVQ